MKLPHSHRVSYGRASALKCEICGREVRAAGILIEVEGAKLTVCDRCRRFGQEVRQYPNQPFASPSHVSDKPMHRIPKRIVKPRPIQGETSKIELHEYELAEDYPQRIRQARETLKVTQTELARRIGERLSIVQKLETGRMSPSDLLVEKIERTLHITLKTPVSDDLISHHYEKPASNLTIGDIAGPVVKKKAS
jgi:putative transcription factor